jgi:hypothetical protein
VPGRPGNATRVSAIVRTFYDGKLVLDSSIWMDGRVKPGHDTVGGLLAQPLFTRLWASLTLSPTV